MELIRLKDEHDKVATVKDDKLRTVVEKRAELEKALEARGHAWDLERNSMLCEAKHLDELLLGKYFPVCYAGLRAGRTFCIADCFSSSRARVLPGDAGYGERSRARTPDNPVGCGRHDCPVHRLVLLEDHARR